MRALLVLRALVTAAGSTARALTMMARPLEPGFLPAALEVEHTPPLAAARGLAWALVALCATVVGWASVAEVDTVASATGRVVPTGQVKTVQAEVGGRVRAIHVADGTTVVAGELLLELDDTMARADLQRLQAAAVHAAREQARTRALLACLAGVGCALTVNPQPASLARQVEREYAAFVAERAALGEEFARHRAEHAALVAEIARLDAVLPLLSERAAALRALEARALAPRTTWLELEETRVAKARERAVLDTRLASAAAAVAGSARRREALVATTEARWMAAAAAAASELERLAQDIAKAAAAVARHRLRAPVSGTVQQLAVHTEGGVVAAATTLLSVVPAGAVPQVEAWIENRDIGFVAPGQAAVVKVETFPFTRYGTLPGRLRAVSPDAVPREDGALLYLAQVALDRAELTDDGRRLPITPGMAVRVEVDLGRRTVLEFLLAPLLRYRDEALGER
ncbi:MAG: HlyD family type I secretion periplasmic adaptor subunit [Gammaproteobacteria bacterium]